MIILSAVSWATGLVFISRQRKQVQLRSIQHITINQLLLAYKLHLHTYKVLIPSVLTVWKCDILYHQIWWRAYNPIGTWVWLETCWLVIWIRTPYPRLEAFCELKQNAIHPCRSPPSESFTGSRKSTFSQHDGPWMQLTLPIKHKNSQTYLSEGQNIHKTSHLWYFPSKHVLLRA